MRLKNISGKLFSHKRPLFFAWFIAGCLSGLLIRQKLPVKFKDELDLLPLIQIGATLIIALLLTHYARQRADEQRVEKEIIIEQLRDCQTKAREIISEFSSCCDEGKTETKQQRELLHLMRELSNLLSIVRKAIEYFGSQAQLVRQWRNIEQSYYSFKPRVTGLDSAADLRNPIFRNNAQITWQELQDQLLKLIFEVNKS